MKKFYDKISETLKSVDLKDERTIQEAAVSLMTESISKGAVVATVHDDETFPYAGLKGKYIGDSDKGHGWADVRYPDGVTVPIQKNLLVTV